MKRSGKNSSMVSGLPSLISTVVLPQRSMAASLTTTLAVARSWAATTDFVDIDTSLQSATAWSNLSGVFSRYRVLRFEVQGFPAASAGYSSGITAAAPEPVIIDYTEAPWSSISTNGLLQDENARAFPAGLAFSYAGRVYPSVGTTAAGIAWKQTSDSNPGAWGTISAANLGAPTVSYWGTAIFRYTVEFQELASGNL